jgi:peptide/nickel transport system substrate-binding protein
MFERRRTMRVAGVAAVAATALLAAGCGSSGTSSGPTTKTVTGATATLPLVTGSGANCIYPFTTTQCYSVANYEDFQYQMVLPLYMFGGPSNTSISVNYDLSPASAPVYSNGGKTVVINLKGWKWSDGTTVNAQSLMLNLNLLEAEKTGYAGYTPGLLPDNMTSYKATGPEQVTLQLKQAYSSIWFTYNQLAILTPMPAAWDVSKAGGAPGSGGCLTDSAADGWAKCKAVYTFMNAQNKITSTYASNPLWKVVNGPYKLTAYNVDGHISMVPNAKYSGSPKAAVNLTFVPYTSDTTVFTALKTGALSSDGPNVGIPSTDLGVAGKGFLPPSNPLASAPNGGYSLSPAYSFGIGYAYINFNNPTYGPVFKQLYFRQALMELNNQAGMSSSVGRGYAYPTTNGVPPYPRSQWVSPVMTQNGGQGPYPYNPGKAESLLAAHGWKKVGGVLTCQSSACGAGIKVGTPAKFAMLYSSGSSIQADQVNILKSGFQAAGIQLATTGETFNTLLGDTVPCKASESRCKWTFLYLGGWLFNGPGFEPTGEPLWQCGVSNNSGSYCDPKMDQLIKATQTSSNLAAFTTYANYNAQQVPSLWLPWQTSVTAASAGLHQTLNGVTGAVTWNPLLTWFPQYWTCSRKAC